MKLKIKEYMKQTNRTPANIAKEISTKKNPISRQVVEQWLSTGRNVVIEFRPTRMSRILTVYAKTAIYSASVQRRKLSSLYETNVNKEKS